VAWLVCLLRYYNSLYYHHHHYYTTSMPFAGFRSKKDASPLIPPVASEPPPRMMNNSSPRPQPGYRADSYDRRSPAPPASRSASSSYADSGYATSRYNASPAGNSYSGNQDDADRDRSELFSGFDRSKATSRNRFMDGPDAGRDPTPGEENEEDVEGIKQQSRYVKQESLQSTRNALRLAREAEETAMNTLNKLGDQSEKFANIERHLDVSKGHAHRAADKTDELKQLNRSIFRPVIVFNKDQKRAAQEAKVQARHDEQRSERERAMTEVRETHNRLRGATDLDDDDEESVGGSRGGRYRTADQLNQRKAQRQRYQFEATASDDELEDGIDDGLDDIMETTKRLKNLGAAMGNELDSQNTRLDGITRKTTKVDDMLVHNTNRLKKW